MMGSQYVDEDGKQRSRERRSQQKPGRERPCRHQAVADAPGSRRVASGGDGERVPGGKRGGAPMAVRRRRRWGPTPCQWQRPAAAACFSAGAGRGCCGGVAPRPWVVAASACRPCRGCRVASAAAPLLPAEAAPLPPHRPVPWAAAPCRRGQPRGLWGNRPRWGGWRRKGRRGKEAERSQARETALLRLFANGMVAVV